MDIAKRMHLAELIVRATRGVCTTMLELDLSAGEPYENPKPLAQAEVTALIGLAGDQQGFVAVHCTHVQAQDFTARLLGLTREDVDEVDAILDAVGEFINMVAGNIKTEFAPHGTLQISLPTVVMTPKSEVRVKAGASVIVELTGALGAFRVELMLTDPGR